jgi:hypothetical protein
MKNIKTNISDETTSTTGLNLGKYPSNEIEEQKEERTFEMNSKDKERIKLDDEKGKFKVVNNKSLYCCS